MNAQPSSYPTTSDISAFMRELGYQWSNEAQIYYDYNYNLVSRKSAERIYGRLIGNNPFNEFVVNGVDILQDKVENN
jgi:hypothetical protein